MVRRSIFTLFALLIACSVNSAQAQEPITEIITVYVLDSYTEAPVENAEVKLYRDGQLVDAGTTDPAGVTLFAV